MTDRPEFFYGLTLRAEDMVARLYVNGAPIAFHAELKDWVFHTGVDRYLHPGENIVTVDYEPINRDARSYTPHEGVQLYLELDQTDGATVLGRIDLFHGHFDPESGRMLAADAHLLTGKPLVTQAGTMHAPARYSVTPVDMNYPDRASGEFARRLELTFTIDDPTLGELPQDGAVDLSDTPELRAELYDAYVKLHTAFATENVKSYGEQMAAILDRFGYVSGYAGREDEVLAYRSRIIRSEAVKTKRCARLRRATRS